MLAGGTASSIPAAPTKMATIRKAPSTSPDLSLWQKVHQHAALMGQYSRRRPIDFSVLFDELREYQTTFERYTGRRLDNAIEIGYGQHPYRMLALHAFGVEVQGVDAEVSVFLRGRPADYWRVLRVNGIERFVKTAVRGVLFDPTARRVFADALHQQGFAFAGLPSEAFAVMDASDFSPSRSADLVYSVNVFEHIEPRSLESVVAKMGNWLVKDGLAFIKPDIWTGFHGGHSIDSRGEPWEHLRRNRFPANTYLNRLTRADYRDLFARHFTILEEIDPPRGRAGEFLTPEIRTELSAYTEQDLLDATPLFVLRPS